MSNTVKIGTIFLACLLNLFQAAALKESIPSTNPRLEKIKWDNSLTLPDLDGKPNIGVAGAFSGFIDNHLQEAQIFLMPHLGMEEIRLIRIQYIV